MITKIQHTDSTPQVLDRSSLARARSLPYARSFVWAVIWSSLHYLALMASITAGVLFFLSPDRRTLTVMIASLMVSLITWIIAFFRRRSAYCPLCKGTPLLSTGALVHRKASRIPPLNHGVSAVVSILAVQRFRCMYCATQYDLLKPRDLNKMGRAPVQMIAEMPQPQPFGKADY